MRLATHRSAAAGTAQGHKGASGSATENVALARVYCGVSPGQRLATARAGLSAIGLAHRLDAVPATMSGGEQQRVAIVRALINQPSLVLCDEPTGNLDSSTSATVLEVLARLNGDGVTIVMIVMITHDPSVAAQAGRVVRIRDGQLTDG